MHLLINSYIVINIKFVLNAHEFKLEVICRYTMYFTGAHKIKHYLRRLGGLQN